MQIVVPAVNAIAVRRKQGANVTFVNQSATDIFFDQNPNRLNASVSGSIPSGTKLAANGGQIQYASYPGIMWFRSATDTTMEVQP